MEPKLSLVEVFSAPQGEGHNSGRPAIFVRFAGCPLACEFAPGVVCDTPYMEARYKVSMNELFNALISPLTRWPQTRLVGGKFAVEAHERPMLILTGGEPTAAPQFDALVDRGLTNGFYVAIETNGTRYRYGLGLADWLSVSPKETVAQTSQASKHNHHPQDPKLDPLVLTEMKKRAYHRILGGEYRYVITAGDSPPPYEEATYHYLSPAVLSDGSGEEWKKGFPGFVPGAVERCLEIIRDDSRWRISIQTHKVLGVR